MDLESLKVEKENQRRQLVAAKKAEVEHAETCRLTALEKIRVSAYKDIPKLTEIEDFAWECAEKFASLIDRKLSTKRKKFLGLFNLSAIETKDVFGEPSHPRLHFSYDEMSSYVRSYGSVVTSSGRTWNWVFVEARDGQLRFSANYSWEEHGSPEYPGSQGTYAEYRSHTTLDADPASLRSWLEAQFVTYYEAYIDTRPARVRLGK